MSDGPQMAVGDQVFDLRWDFFLCPRHGLLTPGRFSDDWTTDDPCPVPGCDHHLTAAYLDSLAPGESAGGDGEEERVSGLSQTELEALLHTKQGGSVGGEQ